MTDPVDDRLRDPAERFLRGDTSVVDFTFEVRRVVSGVIESRPLQGLEVDLYLTLEEWEATGWDGRPTVVERLRQLARSIAPSS